jgi:2-C-methyl-D-erythritol 2,4-cyclodiphosphate synthase
LEKRKVGIGYDIHRLVRGRKLVLGGVEIPSNRGSLGHSDGDCLTHALIDALLGAMGQGDIGRLFPDTDPKFKGVRSLDLLADVVARLRKKRMSIQNVDAILALEEPKLSPYINKIKESLARVLDIETDDIGLKAKTNEGLDSIGRGRAIACWAVALLKK